MANYQPVARTIASTSAISGEVVSAAISTTSWGLLLVRGTAVFSNTLLRSGAVAIWESTNPTTASPDVITFSDANATYGVTTRAGVQLVIKFYSN